MKATANVKLIPQLLCFLFFLLLLLHLAGPSTVGRPHDAELFVSDAHNENEMEVIYKNVQKVTS